MHIQCQMSNLLFTSNSNSSLIFKNNIILTQHQYLEYIWHEVEKNLWNQTSTIHVIKREGNIQYWLSPALCCCGVPCPVDNLIPLRFFLQFCWLKKSILKVDLTLWDHEQSATIAGKKKMLKDVSDDDLFLFNHEMQSEEEEVPFCKRAVATNRGNTCS